MTKAQPEFQMIKDIYCASFVHELNYMESLERQSKFDPKCWLLVYHMSDTKLRQYTMPHTLNKFGQIQSIKK